MNRVLQYLRPCCPCCREIGDTQAQLDRQRIVAERLEEIINPDVAEFCVPKSAETLKACPDDDFFSTGIRLFVTADARVATIDEDLHAYAVTELRRLAGALADAADRLEVAQ